MNGSTRIGLRFTQWDADHVVGEQVVTAPAGGFALARAWWKAAGQVGKHELLYRVELPGSVVEGRWPLTVTASKTRALLKLQAGWIEPLALAAGVYGRDRDMGEDASGHSWTRCTGSAWTRSSSPTWRWTAASSPNRFGTVLAV